MALIPPKTLKLPLGGNSSWLEPLVLILEALINDIKLKIPRKCWPISYDFTALSTPNSGYIIPLRLQSIYHTITLLMKSIVFLQVKYLYILNTVRCPYVTYVRNAGRDQLSSE